MLKPQQYDPELYYLDLGRSCYCIRQVEFIAMSRRFAPSTGVTDHGQIDSACRGGRRVGGTAQAAPLFADDFESYTQAAPGDISANWTVKFGSVDVIGTPGTYAWYPTQQIDLNGSGGAVTAALISRRLSGFVVGSLYSLSFDYGNNKNSNNAEGLSFGLYDATNLSYSLFQQIAIPGAISDLISVTFDFQATATELELFFRDDSLVADTSLDDDQGGPILDNVVVDVAPVPLPAAAPLLLAALGGLSMLRRRRR